MEDVAVFEVLSVGAGLEVLFEGLLALDGGERRFVDEGFGAFACHVVRSFPLLSVMLLCPGEGTER